MKKLIPVFLLIVLLVSSCNFPEEQDLSQDPVVQTRVSALLTQGAPNREEPINIIEPIEKDGGSTETEEAIPTQTEELETPVAPGSTQEVVNPTPEVSEEAPTPTQAAPTPTQAVPTPTQVVTQTGDPWSGTPDFVEEFDAGSYWDFDGDHLFSKAANGQLEFTSKGTPWWSSWYTTNPAQKNGYFETTFTMPNCSGTDRFGLVIRWIHPNVFYYLGVTCDGTWGFSLYNQTHQTIDLVAYATNDALNPVNESNRIGILAKDSSFDFYINGTLVGSATNDGIQTAGTFGFVSMSTGTTNFKTQIDKLQYWAK